MKRRMQVLILAAALVLSILPARAQAAEGGFSPQRRYEDVFSDVARSDWYYDSVKALYELGLTNGKDSGNLFDPGGDLTGAEAVAMAARLRSLYETGNSEAGPAAYGGGGAWYLPYADYLRAVGAIGGELEPSYDRPATRAEMAHVLANALPEELLAPVNEDVVTAGYEAGQYIQDVTAATPYGDDILRLYTWGVARGSDQTGSFQPGEHVSRSQVAALVARLAYPEQRITLDWVVRPAYSKIGATMASLVSSDGTFYESPMPEELKKIDADVRFMLSRGQRSIQLHYPAGTLTSSFAYALNESFLNAIRNYVEQTYNYAHIAYSTTGGYATLTFACNLYQESEVERYRKATMEYAIAVHDRLWETGQLTEDMTQYEKARVYFTWICENCQYDHAVTDTSMSHTGYRLFAEQIAVCDGYTAAYNLLLKLEGIDCGTYSTADHIWTTATLDGQTYHIDTTWGDQSYGVNYEYFAMTETAAVARF